MQWRNLLVRVHPNLGFEHQFDLVERQRIDDEKAREKGSQGARREKKRLDLALYP